MPGPLARRDLDRRLLRAARALAGRGLVTGSVGNLSARPGTVIRVTPTRVRHASLGARDLVTVDLDGDVVRGRRPPTSELALHLALYRADPRHRAVIHTHGIAATAWSFLGEPLAPTTEEIGYYGIGPVTTAQAAPGGSIELAQAAVAAIGRSRAVLLRGHGVVAAGDTIEHALAIAESVEHQAAICWLLRADARGPGRLPDVMDAIGIRRMTPS
jgi:L-fuculose-phosphate aldolase